MKYVQLHRCSMQKKMHTRARGQLEVSVTLRVRAHSNFFFAAFVEGMSMKPPQETTVESVSEVGSGGAPISQSVDWYHEGESRTVEVDGVQVTVRLIGRKGRRSRIAIVAPAGAAFSSMAGKR